ncbi:TRAP-type C4-dicarboxylate transport system, periplasmic component [Caenispirillum salinarum AK4]|uniref:TRAP-type C4-dicarboxylate transport system, periplasmic component n=1 Tax=Caenispirillum salinarum AK4 TaxID=1238182 RepID=K9H1P3_9PROT|nr:TRAP transporter substrate-binding protein DctP [Caenispirillum salinarum]EKV31487.1 TRAP-type C4-dicarboxylate transport system, periplasmic component [Caenispirillum salinarum AK4]
MTIRKFGMALTAAAAVFAGSAVVSAAQAETWKFALEEIDGSVQDAYAERFKELVEERTNGEVTVQIYPYGTLGTSAQLTELVANGTLQFANASPGHLGSLVPEVNVFNLPYILSQSDEVNKKVLTEGETVYNMLAPKLKDKGLHLITMYPEGDMVWTTNKEVRSPEDFSGFKMRTMTSPILTESYKAMGANPTPMPYGEVYGALQLKQIDGQVNPVFAIEEMKFYEVSDYMIWAGQQEFTTTVVANQTFWENLPEDRRQMVDEVASELADFIFDVKTQYAEERLEKIKQAKPDMPMIELTEEERAKFKEAAMGARDTFIEVGGEDAQKVLDALTAEIEETEKEMQGG